jgi:hypothetical protein
MEDLSWISRLMNGKEEFMIGKTDPQTCTVAHT